MNRMTPETACDMDCHHSFYEGQTIEKARAILHKEHK